ncbi:MAG: Crp/Fnr family transcriptional regulator [Anaerolineales bacterium]|nr:Crp/Fnr family transcriptional regulator [Anaerolineales bacterium]
MDKQVDLQQTSLFTDLPIEAMTYLAEHSYYVDVRRGDVMFRQGEHASFGFVMCSGGCRLIQHTLDGRDVVLAIFVRGDPVGLVAAMRDEVFPSSAEIVEDGTILKLYADTVRWLIHHYPMVLSKMVDYVQERLYEAHQNIRALSTERVERRLARVLVYLVDKTGLPNEQGTIVLTMAVSRQELAEMSGTTLETVSRTLKQWERNGLLEAGREQITIFNREELVYLITDVEK